MSTQLSITPSQGGGKTTAAGYVRWWVQVQILYTCIQALRPLQRVRKVHMRAQGLWHVQMQNLSEGTPFFR